jgi:putative ABC transport system substrate-binding protein
MRRRELMLLLGGAMTSPRALRAQQKAMPVIGYLSGSSPGPSASNVAAFHHGLGETGYVEGQNLAMEYRWAEGRYDRLPRSAACSVMEPASALSIARSALTQERSLKVSSPPISSW